MKLYPIFLKLEGRACLVVGGGSVAERKARSLLQSGAQVRMVSLEFTCGIEKLSRESKNLIIHKKPYEEEDLKAVALVVAATDDRETNEKISKAASKRGIMVNVVDVPELCSFFLPSTVYRGDLAVAISTGGRCPAFAKKLRQKLEAELGDGLGLLVECLGAVRNELLLKYPGDSRKRGLIMGKIVDSDLMERASGYSREELLSEMRKWI